ncbi:peroxidase 64 [Dorcoceras hygrometricum]|uniref:Peroxidase 64 n=1 Tax=Dorcoceras hygrometricum TaxID=472368 RepID=A0A2Z7DH47_9LAMI|nr:peroxidase 64 [Dorcoceras hygrometricum]
MRMSFTLGKDVITLTGDPSLSRSVISTKSLLKVADVEFSGVLWGVETEDTSGEVGSLSRELDGVLQLHERLFDEPRGLPPTRRQDHAIILKEGYGPVQVRPYLYAHHQKDEIEKMVTEMLQSGVIQPSCSPFSSSVILVKKRWKLEVLRRL